MGKKNYIIFPIRLLKGLLAGNKNDSADAITVWLKEDQPMEPMALLNIKYYRDFFDSKTTELQEVVFAFTAGVSSIIGRNKSVKTNKAMILARAFGFNTPQEQSSEGSFPDIFKKYETRYHFDKVMDILSDKGINRYGFRIRGLYLSYNNRMSLTNLIVEAELKKKKQLRKNKKTELKTARIKALKIIEEMEYQIE